MEFHVQWFDRLSSTNTWLLDRIRGGERMPWGLVIAAREQTRGRGRFERRWVGAAGRNLAFSMLLPPPEDPAALPSLSMTAALAVDEVLLAQGLNVAVKWPNDVRVGSKKICGILSESAAGAGMAGVVTGVGINVNMTREEAATIDQPATSLLVETGESWNLEPLLDAVLLAMRRWYRAWEEKGFSGLRPRWQERCRDMGRRVTVDAPGGALQGLVAGFGDTGELLLRKQDGSVDSVWAGDVRHLRRVADGEAD